MCVLAFAGGFLSPMWVLAAKTPCESHPSKFEDYLFGQTKRKPPEISPEFLIKALPCGLGKPFKVAYVENCTSMA